MKTFIQTPTRNLQDSLKFYSKLEFRILSETNPLIVTDGKAVIEINADRYARAGLKLFRPDWQKTAELLGQITSVMKTDDGYLLTEPSGMYFYLVESEKEINAEISESSFSVLGNYAGICLETPGAAKSTEILEVLGFSRSHPDWPTYSNSDGISVTVFEPNNCPHLFFNPSLTYFNGKQNEEVIEKIRSKNIPFAEEITHFNSNGVVDNVIIRDPGGLGFFIFND